MNVATFFLSAGRSGTRWLSTSLKDSYGDLVLTDHEPLFREYLPRQLLGTKDPARSDNARLVFTHAEEIEECLVSMPYIECGWPCYGAIPYFADRFDGRIRVVHLTRHPVPCASSMVTHRYYAPGRDGLTEKALLTPFDEGVRFVDYRSRWNSLDEFEKCLYFWTEIHALGLRLEHELSVPWLRLKSEDLFINDGLDLLLDFLELPRRESIYGARGRIIDHHHYRTNIKFDIDVIKNHPHVLAVSETLGYKPFDKDPWRIGQRYQAKHRNEPSVGTSKSVTFNSRRRNAPCPCGSGKRYKRCHGKLG